MVGSIINAMHGRRDMKVIFKYWTLKSGQTKREINLPKTKDGYIRKKPWRNFESALKELNGRKVRIEIEQ